MRNRILLLLLTFTFAASLAAAGDKPCQDGKAPIGWLGIREFSETRMEIKTRGDSYVLRFHQEPRIGAVGGPARGKLRPGDVVTTVDGAFVTTRQGSANLYEVEPGQVVRLGIRRDGELRDVEVRAEEICPEDAPLGFAPPPVPPLPPAPPAVPAVPPVLAAPSAVPAPEAPPALAAPAAAPAPPEPPTLATPSAVPAPAAPPVLAAPSAPAPPAPPALPAPPLATSEGWLGFGFECDDCGWGEDGFFFRSPPRVYSVDPDGPAAEAGLLRGDLLTHAGGEDITTKLGSKLFFSARPETGLRIGYRRGGEARKTEILARPRPWSTVPRAELQGERRLRWTGTLGSTDVEVRGLDSVYVTVDEERGTVSIRTLDATVRLSLSPSGGDGEG